jgi:putative beta-lysine N-acetyltransferase
MFDKTEKVGHSLIQHGKCNNRIYLMKYDVRDRQYLAKHLFELAKKKGYGKIIAKVPKSACRNFITEGYKSEGEIKHYYKNGESCKFLSKFLCKLRAKSEKVPIYNEIIKASHIKKHKKGDSLPGHFHIEILSECECNNISSLYKEVFETYPFPVFDPQYIKDTMKSNVVYFGVFYKKELVGIASGEIDIKEKNAEMTDFAILPDCRGKSISKHLLKTMHLEMRKKGVKTLYSLARAMSLPMNSTFAALGYNYRGTLINNTQISGKIESMNIWDNSAGV